MIKSIAIGLFFLIPFASIAFAATTTSATVGTTASTVLASNGHLRSYIGIMNQSSTATISCAHGSTPTLNGAGSVTIQPLGSAVWTGGSWSTADSWSCISSAVSTPVSVESQP